MAKTKTRKTSEITKPPPRAVLSDTLPLPERKFGGRIGTYYTDSKAEVPDMPSAPDGAPNVLLVLLDDVGLRAPEHVRRPGPARQGAAAASPTRARLQPLPHDRALLSDARGAC